MKHGIGAYKDKEDKRDYSIKSYFKKVELPTSMDLSNNMQPVRDQGSEGSCVAFASCAMKESQEDNEGLLSTRFMYERIKQPGGGSYPRDAMESLLKVGVCPEDCQKYVSDVYIEPCDDSLNLAKQNKIKQYARLLTVDDFKNCIIQFGSFVASFEIRDGWLYPDINGVVHIKGQLLGGHAVCIVGYDDVKQLLKFKNSWGTTWGNKGGYGYISYTDAISSLYDAWKTLDIPEDEEDKSIPPPPPPPKPKKRHNLWMWLRSLFN